MMNNDNVGIARVIKGVGGNYWLRTPNGDEGMAAARGIFRNINLKLLPGDRVKYAETGETDAPFVINKVLPRKNELERPPLANLDGLILVFALKDPDPDLLLLDKLLTKAVNIDVPVYLVFTKEDLADVDSDTLIATYRKVVTRIQISDGTGDDVLEALRGFTQDKLVTVAGPSGAGKSTLINRLFGKDHMIVGEVSGRTGRGKQTTRHTELFWHGSGFLADTPGFSSLSVEQMGIEVEDLLAAYHDLGADAGECRFNTCKHLVEPGCIVRERVDAKETDSERYERYKRLREELDAVTHW